MNENERNILCAVMKNAAADIIADAALLRHYEECQGWAKEIIVNDLRRIVAAAAFFGVTTDNVKDEKECLVKWFNDKE